MARSDKIAGAGMFATAPYGYTLGEATNAVLFQFPDLIDVDELEELIKDHDKDGKIDSVSNIKNSKVYIQGGISDNVVYQGSSIKTAELYWRLGADVKSVFGLDSVHIIPRDDDFTSNRCNAYDEFEIFAACEYDGVKELLNHLLGDLNKAGSAKNENFFTFDQNEFFPDGGGMWPTGIVYVPDACQDRDTECILHIHFHGCGCGVELYGDYYYKNLGFNDIAEENKMIVLYPQIACSEANSACCNDIYGYLTDEQGNLDYLTKDGEQITGMIRMIDRIDGTMDHCDFARVRLIPMYIVIGILVASMLGSVAAVMNKSKQVMQEY